MKVQVRAPKAAATVTYPISTFQVTPLASSTFHPTLLREPWDPAQAPEMVIGSKNGWFNERSKWVECVKKKKKHGGNRWQQRKEGISAAGCGGHSRLLPAVGSLLSYLTQYLGVLDSGLTMPSSPRAEVADASYMFYHTNVLYSIAH